MNDRFGAWIGDGKDGPPFDGDQEQHDTVGLTATDCQRARLDGPTPSSRPQAFLPVPSSGPQPTRSAAASPVATSACPAFWSFRSRAVKGGWLLGIPRFATPVADAGGVSLVLDTPCPYPEPSICAEPGPRGAGRAVGAGSAFHHSPCPDRV